MNNAPKSTLLDQQDDNLPNPWFMTRKTFVLQYKQHYIDDKTFVAQRHQTKIDTNNKKLRIHEVCGDPKL